MSEHTGSNDRTDAELFEEFYTRVADRAANELGIAVETAMALNAIQWGALGTGPIYTLNADRAREEGLSVLVDDAIARIKADPP